MITYKGDRFVKGKTFLYEDEIVKFITKSKKGFVFESCTKGKIVLEESDAKSLKEVRPNAKK